MQDQPDYLTSNHIRIFDARHKELQPSQINWYSEDATHYSFKQDPGSFSSARLIDSIFRASTASTCMIRR